MEISVSDTPAHDAASWFAGQVRDAVRRRGSAAVALSGGSTAPALFTALLDQDMPWSGVTVWQVDERIAPDGDALRNAGPLALLPASVNQMPVTSADLNAAARQYGRGLPDRFDVVHLGVGDDGHTASWPPGNDAIASSQHFVEVVPEFRGVERMTLTARAVNAARSRMVLVHGTGKAPVVARWIDGDRTLPVSSVRRANTRVFLDPGAAGRLSQ